MTLKKSTGKSTGKSASRGAKKFAEKFEKLREALHRANETNNGEFDSAFADLAAHLTSSEKECVYFLETCDDEQFRTVLLVLDDVASEFASAEFLQVLKGAQARFPKYDLTSSMDVAAYETAERLAEEFSKTDGSARKSFAKVVEELREKAELGDPEAMFRLALKIYFGTGTKRDYKAAREWAEQAIEAGCEDAALIRDLPSRL
ncbi:MAG: sel1 repeat family protein [Thermoguttaceae bacterium]|nr:sel1 repeat family protein [Thermoguttaceae bacterium]